LDQFESAIVNRLRRIRRRQVENLQAEITLKIIAELGLHEWQQGRAVKVNELVTSQMCLM